MSSSAAVSHADPATEGTSTFVLILVANAILGSAMPMLIVLGGLAGLALAPSPTLATLPPSVQMLAGLFAAAPFSLFMGRYGRRAGFITGALVAFAGGILGGIALYLSSFLLLCLAHIAFGAALACFQYFRFAAGEAAPARWSAIAVSLVLGSGLIAAFVGPEIFLRTRDLLEPVPLAGAYIAICPLMMVGIVPLLFARLGSAAATSGAGIVDPVSIKEVLTRPRVFAAVLSGAISYGVMLLLMLPTPLTMVGEGHSEAMAGDVIRWHVVAMFAPSFFTGPLVRRFGTTSIVATGLALLAASCLLAAAGMSAHHFYWALIVLGVGWNFAFIGATTMLSTELAPHERAAVQGTNDTLIALVSTACAFASGAIAIQFGWTALALASLPVVAIAGVGLVYANRATAAA